MDLQLNKSPEEKGIYNLIKKNYDMLQKAKPQVHKNSAGYFLWNVWDKDKDIFDLNKLWTGAQGTHFFVDPKEQLVGVLMVQTTIQELQREFEDLVAQSIVD